MTMPDTEETPLGLPMQPTGSGVAGLETARELDTFQEEPEEIEKVRPALGQSEHDDAIGGAQADNLDEPS